MSCSLQFNETIFIALTIIHKSIFGYRMGRLCGGAHEISGIKAPLFLRGGWLDGSWGGWVVGLVIGWVGGWVGGMVVLWVPMTPPCYFLTIW